MHTGIKYIHIHTHAHSHDPFVCIPQSVHCLRTTLGACAVRGYRCGASGVRSLVLVSHQIVAVSVTGCDVVGAKEAWSFSNVQSEGGGVGTCGSEIAGAAEDESVYKQHTRNPRQPKSRIASPWAQGGDQKIAPLPAQLEVRVCASPNGPIGRQTGGRWICLMALSCVMSVCKRKEYYFYA